MKTYCKPKSVNIDDPAFNAPAVRKCFSGKLRRSDFRGVLTRMGGITNREIAEERLAGRTEKIIAAEERVAKALTEEYIQKRNLKLKPIRQFQREDGLTHKMRDICQESPEQQLMEYIAVNALKPLFRAKLLACQFGSIPGRGQVGGKRKIERLLRRKHHGRLDAVKGDIKKAYPSVTVECVMKLLRRDIGKNKTLLWFVEALMSNYPGGHLCIGGYLPSWLFNYVMSYVLRFMMSCKAARRGKPHKLVLFIMCYADDFAVFGRFGNLKRVMLKTSKWSEKTLGLKIKPAWQIYRIASFEEEKAQQKERRAGSKKRTPGIDMMGFVIRRTYTIIRRRVFRRLRRQIIRAKADINKFGYLPHFRAVRLMSYKGWIVHSNSEQYVTSNNIKKLFNMAARCISRCSRKEWIEHEQRILCITSAGG